MNTGYQIYFKRTCDKVFYKAGPNSWFWKLEDAKARKKSLEEKGEQVGNEYVIVKLG